MKYHLSILTLIGIGLLTTPHVRADEKKPSPLSLPLSGSGPFSSPAVPLTREETKQLETLTRAARAAETEMTATFARNKGTSADKAASLRAVRNEFATKSALASFQSVIRLPLEVRPYLPAGARSLYLGLHAMDATGEPMLLHLWAAPRRAAFGHYDFEPSPFCLDVFKKGGADAPTPDEWTYVTTTSFLAQNTPIANTMSVHFLNATSKQGPVVSFASNSEEGSYLTVLTFPEGLAEDPMEGGRPLPSYVQNLYGGSHREWAYDFGTNERGTMTIQQKAANTYPGGVNYSVGDVLDTLKWNGREYVSSAAK